MAEIEIKVRMPYDEEFWKIKKLFLDGKCIWCGQSHDLCVCDGTRTGARLDNSGGDNEHGN